MASISRPSLGRTPEAVSSGLRRKDSKHIVDTCHGITSGGSPCRRRLAIKDAGLRAIYTKRGRIVLPPGQDATIFVCWQHEDQETDLRARFLAAWNSDSTAGRKSLESLFENLNLEELDEYEEAEIEIPRDGRNIGIHYSSSQHFDTQQLPDELPHISPRTRQMSGGPQADEPITTELFERPSYRELDTEKRRRRRSKKPPPKKEISFLSSLFGCMTVSESEKQVATRPRRRRRSSHGQRSDPLLNAIERTTTTSLPIPLSMSTTDRFSGPIAGNPYHVVRPGLDSSKPHFRRASEGQIRPDSGVAVSPRKRRPSQGDAVKSSASLAPHRQSHRKSGNLQVYRDGDGASNTLLKPPQYHRRHRSQPNAPQFEQIRQPLNARAQSSPDYGINTTGQWTPQLPATADDTARLCFAKLLTSMSQPPTAMDGEGYIYMFWQTDLAATQAETDAAVSIVGGTHDEADQAHDEEILERRFFQTSANAAIPTSAKRTIFLKIGMAKNVHQRIVQWQKQCGYNISLLRYYPQAPRNHELVKVLNVRKVERLVHLHLEMLGYRVKKECRCGTEHREWFEIAGNTTAVREVDNIIEHWVAWSNEKYAPS